MTPVFNHFATCLIVAPLALLPMSLCAQEVPSDTQTVDQAGTFPEYNAKLLLTNAVSAVDGASGGGISNWATIAGRQETRGVGVQAHVTAVLLPDFFYQSHGVALGIADRIELSYARQNFDTQDVGAALGIGQGYMLNQDVFGAKVRLFGDVVYGNTMVPQVAVGAQYKRSLDGAVASAVGAAHDEGVDVTLSATKLLLSHSVLVNTTARLTKANQNGLLGFGSVSDDSYAVQFEGAVAYQFSRPSFWGLSSAPSRTISALAKAIGLTSLPPMRPATI